MRTLFALLTLALLLPAASAGSGTETTTMNYKDEAFSFVDSMPCTGQVGTIDLVGSGVFHETLLTEGKNAGTWKFTFTEQGDFSFTPDGETTPSLTGHYTVWGGWNDNQRNSVGTFTFSVSGETADGDRFRASLVEHFSVSASGIVREFAFDTC